MSELYKVPRQGVGHTPSVHSRGLFLDTGVIATCPADRYGARLRAELCPLQNTCVLSPGPLGCDYLETGHLKS